MYPSSNSGTVGDEVLKGGVGADTLSGTAGVDAVSYADSTYGVYVDLSKGTAADGLIAGQIPAGYSFNSVTGHYYKYVSTPLLSWAQASANASSLTLFGQAGYLATITSSAEWEYAQTLFSSGQDTIFIGGSDAASEGTWRWTTGPEGQLDGGAGVTFWEGEASGGRNGLFASWRDGAFQSSGYYSAANVDYLTMYSYFNPQFSASRADTIGVSAGGGGAVGYLVEFNPGSVDTLVSIENILGSSQDDTLIGDDGNNILEGGDGNDSLDGFGGNDTLFGNDGDDLIFGGSGDDTLDGGAGNDTLRGRDGNDTASYASATAGVTVSLALTTAQDTLGSGTDTITSIENLTGSSFNDKLTGNSSANVINGGAGNDVLNGGDGNDTLIGEDGNDRLNGGSGADVLDGGAGFDTADYSSSTIGLTVNLSVCPMRC